MVLLSLESQQGGNMKIEVGESLACSYLRHVKRCWIVQANWKASDDWEQR